MHVVQNVVNGNDWEIIKIIQHYFPLTLRHQITSILIHFNMLRPLQKLNHEMLLILGNNLACFRLNCRSSYQKFKGLSCRDKITGELRQTPKITRPTIPTLLSFKPYQSFAIYQE